MEEDFLFFVTTVTDYFMALQYYKFKTDFVYCVEIWPVAITYLKTIELFLWYNVYIPLEHM